MTTPIHRRADERRMSEAEFAAREEAWLARVEAKHAPWHTPRTTIDALVRRATGAAPASVVRVEGGLSNEVYRCDAGNARVVVRLGRARAPHFEQEHWAIEAARARGIPVPEVLLVAHEPTDDGFLSASVLRFVEGVALGTLARRRGGNDPLVVAATRAAGRLLAAMHEIRTSGFGPLDANGEGPEVDWPSVLDPELRVSVDPPPEVHRAIAALADARERLAASPSRLLHFDYEPGHILVEPRSGAIVGIIDFEEARGGDPAYDLMQWLVFHDVYTPVAPLLEGYWEIGGSDSHFDERLLLSEIHYRTSELLRGSIPNAFVGEARRRLALALSELEASF